MKIAGKSVVVTGGASGIGRPLAERFAAEGARGVVVADLMCPNAVYTGMFGRPLDDESTDYDAWLTRTWQRLRGVPGG